MDPVDRRLLDCVQAGLPLVERPFAAVGEALGLGESEVLERLGRLRDEGVVRQLCAIFDTARLGYASSLVAARVAPARIEAAARIISAHPGVSHNYERDFEWNLWFTLAVPPDSTLGLDQTAAILARRAGLDAHRLLPALRVFKIGVKLDMEEGATPARREAPGAVAPPPVAVSPSASERLVIQALQEPLALVAEPFAAAAQSWGLDAAVLLERGRAFLGAGVIRRVAALLHHRRAGFSANAMGVWAVPAPRVEAVGQTIAQFRAVTHCYERPRYADWPYSVFSMVHGRSREECVAVLDAIAEATGVGERAVLWSLREFKKVRLRYFTPDYAEWERAA